MSKKNGNNNAVAIRPAFEIDMPDNAPALGFDPNAETFSWRDVYPSNYWNLDLLEEKAKLLGGNPVLSPARFVIKPVLDPEIPEDFQELTPKIVLEFEEHAPALVFNKTRCTLMTKITGTPNPARWMEALNGIQLELYAGAYRDMASAMQILFRTVAARANDSSEHNAADKKSIEEINDDLFG